MRTIRSGRNLHGRIVGLPIFALTLAAQGATASAEGQAPSQTAQIRCTKTSEARALGSHGRLSGTIEIRNPVAVGAEAPPAGAYLILSAPIRVADSAGRAIAGGCFSEVFVEGRQDLLETEQLELHGRLDLLTFGGVETPASRLIALSGVSVTGVRDTSPIGRVLEPLYDGRVFRTSGGEILAMLAYRAPEAVDLPAIIFVLDVDARLAFIGNMGGFIPPERNPFHGFRGTAPLEAPNEIDRAAIRFEGEQAISNETGEILERIGVIGPEVPYPDAITQTWYFDPSTETAYGFASGGFAGWTNELVQVIRVR